MITISENEKENINRKIPLEHIWYQMALPHPTVFVKKDVYDKMGLFDVRYRLAADYELLLRFYSGDVRFGYIDKVITYFRRGGLSTKRKKEIYCEGYEISMSYIDKCPNKDQMVLKIKDTYDWACFNMDVLNVKGALGKLICEYFHKTIATILIFGTGVCAEQCFENLSDSGVKILYFIDNDIMKCNIDFHGIKVISFNELQYIDIPVLIAVKEYGEDIKKQLVNRDGGKLKCVSIKELELVYLTKFGTYTN